ncbi:MAG: hypothetical protein KC776_12325 [Myxococcales bacterium]|nr:hypothetical protein [Myxococcales bacterium]MCB9580986.1 hypothetical protein [Polyangiaceae bacterium]
MANPIEPETQHTANCQCSRHRAGRLLRTLCAADPDLQLELFVAVCEELDAAAGELDVPTILNRAIDLDALNYPRPDRRPLVVLQSLADGSTVVEAWHHGAAVCLGEWQGQWEQMRKVMIALQVGVAPQDVSDFVRESDFASKVGFNDGTTVERAQALLDEVRGGPAE